MNAAQEALFSFLETAKERFAGRVLRYSESLCTFADNYDRHFTSFSKNEFVVDNISVRFSGARLQLDGVNAYYEVAVDYLIIFKEINANEFELTEAYTDKIYRKTTLIFV